MLGEAARSEALIAKRTQPRPLPNRGECEGDWVSPALIREAARIEDLASEANTYETSAPQGGVRGGLGVPLAKAPLKSMVYKSKAPGTSPRPHGIQIQSPGY